MSRIRYIAYWSAVLLVAGACGSPGSGPDADSGSGSGPLQIITGRALAGPVCPVETDPPDPACAPRAVSGAVIEVFDEERELIATVTTDDDGVFTVELSDGRYELVPSSVAGLLGTAAPVEVIVAGQAVEVGNLFYDTGIR